MLRSTVLNLPPQLVFPGLIFVSKAGAYPGGASQRYNEVLDEDKIAENAKHIKA